MKKSTLNIHSLITFAVIMASLVFISGCASTKEMSKSSESKKLAQDFAALKIGSHRHNILAKFGTPVLSESTDNGGLVDIFRFTKGEHGAVKGLKALASAATYGVSRVILIDNVESFAIRVNYGSDNKVVLAEILREDEWVSIEQLDMEQ